MIEIREERLSCCLTNEYPSIVNYGEEDVETTWYMRQQLIANLMGWA